MTTRQADPRIVPLFVERWSPRAYDESAMPQADLDTILEAATWAPSAYNHQPWRFLYAHRGDANWEGFLSALVPFNQSWAKDASVLLFFVSEEKMGDNPNHSHSFDTGAAWAQLALQSHALGYAAHGMTGVDWDKARDVLGVPEGYRIEAAAAIGRQTSPEKLPEGLREREAPSGRKPVSEVSAAGRFAW
jgi:nitroreductase